jgi:hypothetical protein
MMVTCVQGLRRCALTAALALLGTSVAGWAQPADFAHLEVRGVYGGVPRELVDTYGSLEAAGVNAVFLGAGSFSDEVMEWLRSQQVKVYAEFNSLHDSAYIKEHPDAQPTGPDGLVSPPPDGWQGVCPTHQGYRRHRMNAFRDLVTRFALDGVWLDYHHSHSSWEQAEPNLPDTCFCERCLQQFQRDTRTPLAPGTVPQRAQVLLTELRDRWMQWRCGVLTDWVREYRELLDAHRPGSLLGTYHNPWSDRDFDGARLYKLAIDLRAQAQYIDVFSPMPYHARFGYSQDPEWIARQVTWLGTYLGDSADKPRQIWPIVQLSDWGEEVRAEQIRSVMEAGARPPATGIMVFAWSGLRNHPGKLDEMVKFYRSVR